MPYFFYLWVEDGFIRSNPNQQKEAGEGGKGGEGAREGGGFNPTIQRNIYKDS